MKTSPTRYSLSMIVAVTLVLVTAGCASAPARSAGPAYPTFRSAKYLPALTTSVDLNATGITLSPVVNQGLVPPISGSQAFQTCTTGDSVCDPAQSPNIYLAMAEDPESGMTKQLVWIVDYPRSTCTPLGHPPAQSSGPQPTLSPYPCRLVNLVNSSTGKVLWSVRIAP